MPDDLDNKLKQIADMFGISDTGGLKNLVENIIPPSSNNNYSSPTPDAATSNFNPGPSLPAPPQNGNRGSNIDLSFLSKANEMLSAFNNVRDSRIALLNSVQPFLGTQRQQRVSGAVQLLKIIAVISSIAPSANRNIKG